MRDLTNTPYKQFIWFIAEIVETNTDTDQLGRVRIRVLGFHSEDTPNDKLPLALVMNGGAARLVEKQWVVGFFLDGAMAQQPFVLGTVGSAIGNPAKVNSNQNPGPSNEGNGFFIWDIPKLFTTDDESETEEELFEIDTAVPTTERVLELQSKTQIRKLPISGKLKSVLVSAAIDCDLYVVVTSGGQPPAPGGPRIGSTRHDNGNAADFSLYYPNAENTGKSERMLSSGNSSDLKRIQEFLASTKKYGAQGIGHGKGETYMGSSKFHVDVMSPGNVWGENGNTLQAPSWLKDLGNNPDRYYPPAQLVQANNKKYKQTPTTPTPVKIGI